jgi:AcrR family transcriptional regulator
MGRIKGKRNQNLLKRRKEMIMISTYLMIVEKSYSDITIKDIAEKANISTGLLFYYFKSKEEIFIETLNWVHAKIAKRLEKKLADVLNPVEKLIIRIEDSFLSIKENRRFYLFYLDFLREGARNKKFEVSNNKFNILAKEKSVKILEDGIKQGVFRKDLNIDDASAIIKALIDGLLIQWLFDKPETFEIYKKRAVETVLYYVLTDISTIDNYMNNKK